MSRRGARWLSGFRALGQASVELLGAELAALGEDLKGSGRILSRSLALLLLAIFLLFWALGALVYTAIVVLALWLPAWGAALVVLGALLLAALAVAGIGWRRIRRLETPAGTVRRHVTDHARWLRSQSLDAAAPGAERELED